MTTMQVQPRVARLPGAQRSNSLKIVFRSIARPDGLPENQANRLEPPVQAMILSFDRFCANPKLLRNLLAGQKLECVDRSYKRCL
jgi:hypothetical protein